MNWGTKIVIGLGTFMLFIIGASIYMVSKDSDSLIDEDYYEKSLSYDDEYDRKQNLIVDHVKPVLSVKNDTLTILFATRDNKGELNLKRPSNGALDKKISISAVGNEFKLPLSPFARGNWSVEIKWESVGKKYQHNQPLFL